MHESTADAEPLGARESFQIGVGRVLVADPSEEVQPATPAAIVLLMGVFGDSFFPGQRCAIEAILEVYFSGSWTIFIWDGERDGCKEVSIETIWSSERWKSRDRESATTFFFPGRCWE